MCVKIDGEGGDGGRRDRELQRRIRDSDGDVIHAVVWCRMANLSFCNASGRKLLTVP